MNGAGDDDATFSSAGAASCAKRLAANLLCLMLISSKRPAPQMLRFMHTARRCKEAMPSVFEPTSLFRA